MDETKNPVKKRKRGGAKLSRSKTVMVRLDPRLKYLAEIGARVQRRTLSAFIEWAVEQALDEVELKDGGALGTEGQSLWDVNDVDRFVMLASRHPELLTYDEQILWKLISEDDDVLLPDRGKDFPDSSKDTIPIENFRDDWEIAKAISRGERDILALSKPRLALRISLKVPIKKAPKKSPRSASSEKEATDGSKVQ